MNAVVALPQPVPAEIVDGFHYLASVKLSPRQPVTVTGIYDDLTAYEIEVTEGKNTRKQRLRTSMIAAIDDDGRELLESELNRLKKSRRNHSV